MADDDAKGEDGPGRVRGLAGGTDRGVGLGERQARVVQERPAGVGGLDAARAAPEEGGTDLVLQVADLAAERGLGGVQALLGRER